MRARALSLLAWIGVAIATALAIAEVGLSQVVASWMTAIWFI